MEFLFLPIKGVLSGVLWFWGVGYGIILFEHYGTFLNNATYQIYHLYPGSSVLIASFNLITGLIASMGVLLFLIALFFLWVWVCGSIMFYGVKE